MREIRRGKKFISVHGETYQHHDVWIDAFEEWFVSQIAENAGMDENHVIGKMVEQWIGQNASLADRTRFYNEVTYPKLLEKYKEAKKEPNKFAGVGNGRQESKS